jgi:flavin-dependent dehydrogenase
MERCDVLIVGGGPAGSSCAWALRRSGFDVVVADRSAFPRDKVCAGWITPPVLEALEVDRTEYAASHVLQPVVGFRVSLQGGKSVEVDYGRVVSWAIRRCELDNFLLRRSGARLVLGEPIRELKRSAWGYAVDDRIEARVVVGAGGHFCPVARRLGGGSERAVVAREFEVHVPGQLRDACATRADVPELVFCADLQGYGWIVRKGDFFNVGLGRLDPEGMPAETSAFLERLRAEGRIPAGVDGRWHGHAYLTREHATRPLVVGDTVLIGDAAGLAADTSGEGIRAAVESGLLAGRAIEQRFASNVWLGSYAEAATERFGRRGRERFSPTSLVPSRWRPAVAARVLANPWFARHVVLDRWFLDRAQPGL